MFHDEYLLLWCCEDSISMHLFRGKKRSWNVQRIIQHLFWTCLSSIYDPAWKCDSSWQLIQEHVSVHGSKHVQIPCVWHFSGVLARRFKKQRVGSWSGGCLGTAEASGRCAVPLMYLYVIIYLRLFACNYVQLLWLRLLLLLLLLLVLLLLLFYITIIMYIYIWNVYCRLHMNIYIYIVCCYVFTYTYYMYCICVYVCVLSVISYNF